LSERPKLRVYTDEIVLVDDEGRSYKFPDVGKATMFGVVIRDSDDKVDAIAEGYLKTSEDREKFIRGLRKGYEIIEGSPRKHEPDTRAREEG
jgi:hypothetical protein